MREAERVARGLSDVHKQTLDAVYEVIPASEVAPDIGEALYAKGLIGKVLAAGHAFVCLTPLGLEVRSILKGERDA